MLNNPSIFKNTLLATTYTCSFDAVLYIFPTVAWWALLQGRLFVKGPRRCAATNDGKMTHSVPFPEGKPWKESRWSARSWMTTGRPWNCSSSSCPPEGITRQNSAIDLYHIFIRFTECETRIDIDGTQSYEVFKVLSTALHVFLRVFSRRVSESLHAVYAYLSVGNSCPVIACVLSPPPSPLCRGWSLTPGPYNQPHRSHQYFPLTAKLTSSSHLPRTQCNHWLQAEGGFWSQAAGSSLPQVVGSSGCR